MSKFNEEKTLAILFSNFSGKGKQIHDWIFLAKKLQELRNFYKSEKKVADNLGMSYEMVRSTIKLLDLPNEVQELLKEGRLSQDLGWRLLGIKNKDNQIKVAKSITGLNAHDARDMIRYAKNNPDKPVEKQIERLKESRAKNELNLIVLSLDEENYKLLKEIANKNDLELNKMISKILSDWLIKNSRKQ